MRSIRRVLLLSHTLRFAPAGPNLVRPDFSSARPSPLPKPSSSLEERQRAARARFERQCVEITPAAQARLSEIMSNADSDRTPIGVRLGVRRRGCNGLSYTMHFEYDDDEHAKKRDSTEVVQCGDATLFVDREALFAITGTEMDFVDEVTCQEFRFNNPNASGSCGCGEGYRYFVKRSKRTNKMTETVVHHGGLTG